MLRKVLQWLGFRPRVPLRFVSGPTEVRVLARITSPNQFDPPLMARKVALLRCCVAQRYEVGSGEDRETVTDELGSTFECPEHLLLEAEDGVLLVPAEGLRVTFVGDALNTMTSFQRDLPEELMGAVDCHSRGELLYGEQFLSHGDLVEIDGTVGPSPRPDVAWEVLPSHGGAIIHDRTLQDLGL